MADRSNSAFNKIRSMILSGEFAPGARLTERELVDRLSVSRTPVREALRRLSAEGLVTFEPNRGARVQKISAQDIEDLFELGLSLESFASQLAAERATPEDVEALEALARQLEEVVQGGGDDFLLRYIELDFVFHNRIVQAARNRQLSGLVKQVVGLPALVNIYTRYERKHFERSCRQHREICDAIKAADVDWAGAATRNHILSGKHYLDPH